MAAAEETSRGSRKETPSDQNGWSRRIGFPHEKAQPEEKIADDSAIYNPMNRDLRTVVETAAEKAAEKNAAIQTENKEESRVLDGKANQADVDLAAVAPAGLPKDVTPEEVAAITAAAARIQRAGAAVEDEHRAFESRSSEAQISGTQISETQISETASQGSLEPPSDRVEDVEDNVASPVREDATTGGLQENRIDVVASEAVATETEAPLKGDVRTEETQDFPVTMAAATAESAAAASVDGSRWTAVPVALEGEEATISLEQEMQKAYAAYAPYVAAVADTGAQEVETATGENSSLPEVAAVVEAAPAENFSSPEVAMVEPDAGVLPTAFVEANAATSPVAESVGSGAETDVPAPVAAPVQELQPQEAQAWPEAEPAMAEAATPSSGGFAPVADAQEHAEESQPDSEAVKSTAAAWASWRQVRDTRKDGEAALAQPKEFEVPEPAPAETAARAVAAGAEQIMQEASAASKADPADVASIVESVLANLRPKLMEEISRKMAEKK